MQHITARGLAVGIILMATHSVCAAQDQQPRTTVVSFDKDVKPLIERACIPCHAEENSNPSELSLDTYQLLMAGGKHGAAVVAGDSARSILVRKIGPTPPFGDRMPLNKKKNASEARKLAEEEIRTIALWVAQGASNN